jgi:hypothetical protein
VAAFRQFNIQLLPLDTRTTDEVGAEGYKKLLKLVKERVSIAVEEKTLNTAAYPLANDTHFSPFFVHPEDKFGHGRFIRYHRAPTVSDLYTKEELYKAGASATAIANVFLIPFVFSYATHRLAVEEYANKLPSTRTMIPALEHFFGPVAKEHFPAHYLTVTLVSEIKALETALAEAEGFRTVNVKLTFNNGPRIDRRLNQLRDNNIAHLGVTASAERGSLMPNLPLWLLDFLRASVTFGETYLSYVKENGKRAIFQTLDAPAKIRLRLAKGESEEDFIERVYNAMLGRFTKPKKPPTKKVTAKKVPVKKIAAKKAPNQT